MTSEDSELWAIVGIRWVIPVYARETEPGIAFLTPAIPLLPIQTAALLLTLEGKEWQSKGKTWINMSTLPDVGVKLDKVKDGVVQDPQKVLVWLPQKVEERSDGDEDDSEWIRYARRSGFLRVDDTLKAAWRLFVKVMPMWLFVEGRTLDLHVCKMRMVPFRPDFKQRMMELSKIESMEQFNDPSAPRR